MGRQTVMNSITSDELLKQVNPENKQLLDDFVSYLSSVQRSETTIRGYVNDIEIAWVWCLEHNGNKSFTEWTKRNIVQYQNWLLNENKNSPARIRRLKAALSSLSNYIENVLDDEYPAFRNIINKVESPVNRPVREKTVLEDAELEKLLGDLTDARDYEKACFLALAMYSGRRKAELCRFRTSDFTDDRLVCDGALYKSAPIKTKGRGGGKMLCCYTLAKKIRPYLERWMRCREQNGIDSVWMFPAVDNADEPLKISTVNSWVNTFSRMTGRDFYMHALRHYFTTALAKAGIPDSVIVQIQGWGSADMCRIYTDIDADEQIGQYFKNGDISVDEKKELHEI